MTEEPLNEAANRLERAEALLEKVESLRQRLEQAEDPDTAIEVLTELAEVAKQAEAEVAAAKRAADARS
jgi:cell division FtsZ-interacting protein ZapD